MPIRPIDLQVAIPKLPEVSRMNHLEQQKAGLHEQQGSRATDKSADKQNRTVLESQKDSSTNSEADARKKGRNSYSGNNQRRNSKEVEPVKQPPKSDHKIDIRI
jgi:phage-related minor tail protein